MEHIEKSTIDAINHINKEYPYAASMLIFVLIERQLKEYILKNRHTEALKMAKVRIGGKQLKDFDGENDDYFVEHFIKKLPLGKTEEILGIHKDKPSELRNDMMHSNRYITCEKNLPKSIRHSINKSKFENAKKHLLRVFAKYSDVPIVEDANGLSFQS